jgi:hypothetical protein
MRQRDMDFKEEPYKKEWKVVSLGGGSVPEGVIRIDDDKFMSVRNYCSAKGYRDIGKSDKEFEYEHYALSGLHLFINPQDKIIRAESVSENALYQIVDDFNLPMY